MRCSQIKKYDGRVAIGEEHTRHNRCDSRSFSNLSVVDASGLDSSLLLLVGLIGAVSMRKLRCRIDVSGLRAVAGKMTWFAAVEAGVLGKRCLRRSRSSGIPLLLRGPIVLQPQDVLLHWSNYHLMLSLWLKSRPGRRLIYHSGALGSTSRKSSCDLGLPLLKVMKTEIFLHSDGVIHHLIEILKMMTQAGP